MRALALLLLSGCTLSAPFGTQCVSDQNCGCANCCISYRCNAFGPGIDDDSGMTDLDAGTVWRVSTFVDVDAGLSAPTALAIDAADNLYVADTNNGCVRKVDPSGALSTVACGMNGPQGVAVSPGGDVFMADTSNHCIRVKRAGSSTVSVLAGACSAMSLGCQDYPYLEFSSPAGLAVSGSTLFAAELGNNMVRWMRTSDGQGGTMAGKGSSTMPRSDGNCTFGTSCGASSSATFAAPYALALADASTLFIADAQNCALRKMTTMPGCSITTVGPRGCPSLKPEWNMSQLLYPGGVAVARDWATSGLVYVTDDGNQRVASLDSAGAIANVAGSGIKGYADGLGSVAAFSEPAGIVVDSAGRLYVADTGNNRIRLLVQEPR